MTSQDDPLRVMPTKHAPETRADIGAALKASRLKKGHSLEAVAEHTRIPKKFLDALEGNRFEEFPALAYLRGFLKNYCDYLEADFETLWRQLVQDNAEAAGSAAAPADPKAPAEKPAPSRASAPAPSSGPPWLSLGLLIAAAAAAGGLALARRRAAVPPSAQTPPVPAALQPIRSPVEPQLLIEYRQDAWVRVVVDGATAYEGLVPRNSRQQWKARRSILLRTANPDALQLRLNGNRIPLPAPDSTGAYRIESP